ncbi:hypothetical protein RHGRI_030125 [Rhododendron griersonianum]|uniref:Uncharacterized protein n=1 Tax=Rhododendron griersonianum TaxID=479676 RepID=A0AAV6ISQ1_9ERIC|nr:hypothetical protein RHGRI_037007 [Rhododendron griersonianum]KAG5529639.1 hypothetical protein RHGRI_030125 [Rhododendron griersonianum]
MIAVVHYSDCDIEASGGEIAAEDAQGLGCGGGHVVVDVVVRWLFVGSFAIAGD